MSQIIAKKEPIIKPELKMEVFHEDIYWGKERMVIVGIRENQIELYGDWSGGTNTELAKGNSWMPLKGAFKLVKICPEHLNPNGCQLHNLHCGFPSCEPEIESWGHYVKGELTDVVTLQS